MDTDGVKVKKPQLYQLMNHRRLYSSVATLLYPGSLTEPALLSSKSHLSSLVLLNWISISEEDSEPQTHQPTPPSVQNWLKKNIHYQSQTATIKLSTAELCVQSQQQVSLCIWDAGTEHMDLLNNRSSKREIQTESRALRIMKEIFHSASKSFCRYWRLSSYFLCMALMSYT